MKRTLRIALAVCLALAFLCPMAASAQQKNTEKRKVKVQKPDLEAVKDSTLNPMSQFYYPTLMAKYEKDIVNSMNPDEYRYLYLGYMFQEDFDPYRVTANDKLIDYDRDPTHYSHKELNELISSVLKGLDNNPFDFQKMAFLVKAYRELKKDKLSSMWEFRLENFLAAILSTGSGQDMENAYYVMTPMHEYDIVKFLGYRATENEYFEPGYDYLHVEPDDNNKKAGNKIKGFYFNVIVPSQQYELKHPDEVEEDDEEIDIDDEPALE